MTKHIVQSDIELAKRLIEDQYRDDQIIAQLTRRRIDPLEAREMLAALRENRVVVPTIPVAEAMPARPSANPATEYPEEDEPPSRKQRAPGRRGRGLLLVAAGLGIILGGIYYVYHLQTNSMMMQLQNLEAAAQKATPAEQEQIWKDLASLTVKIKARKLNSQEQALVLRVTSGIGGSVATEGTSAAKATVELRDGLLIGGISVSKSNALSVLKQVCGNPTRTQRGEGMDILYAFDQHGILLYDKPEQDKDFLVLDLAGTGGESGAKAGFSGELVAEGNPVSRNTAAEQLMAIRQLNVKTTEKDTGILGGNYLGMELIFVYLHNRSRLDSIQINLP